MACVFLEFQAQLPRNDLRVTKGSGWMWGISAGRTRCAAVCGEMFPALNRGQERVLRLQERVPGLVLEAQVSA